MAVAACFQCVRMLPWNREMAMAACFQCVRTMPWNRETFDSSRGPQALELTKMLRQLRPCCVFQATEGSCGVTLRRLSSSFQLKSQGWRKLEAILPHTGPYLRVAATKGQNWEHRCFWETDAQWNESPFQATLLCMLVHPNTYGFQFCVSLIMSYQGECASKAWLGYFSSVFYAAEWIVYQLLYMKFSFYAHKRVGLEGHFLSKVTMKTVYTGCVDCVCVWGKERQSESTCYT